jgi:ribosomal protein S24E
LQLKIDKMENLTILKQKENPLFNRKELEIDMESNVTPNFKYAEEALSKKFSVSPESIKIKKIDGKFGSRNFIISVNIYHSKEDKDKTERKSKKERKAEETKTEATA